MEIITAHPVCMIGISPEIDLALDGANNLLVYHVKNKTAVNLGPLTQQRAREINKYLEHLAIHTPER